MPVLRLLLGRDDGVQERGQFRIFFGRRLQSLQTLAQRSFCIDVLIEPIWCRGVPCLRHVPGRDLIMLDRVRRVLDLLIRDRLTCDLGIEQANKKLSVSHRTFLSTRT